MAIASDYMALRGDLLALARDYMAFAANNMAQLRVLLAIDFKKRLSGSIEKNRFNGILKLAINWRCRLMGYGDSERLYGVTW